MAILVTGGAGYIGSHCVARLLADGIDTVVIDNLSTGYADAVKSPARLYAGDLLDAEFVRSVFKKEKIEGIIHFAAFSLVGESVNNPQKYFKNNIGVTMSVLDAMLEFGVKDVIFSSTAATYGEPEITPILETAPQIPTNPYGESKLACEKIFKWYAKAYGIRYAALRYFNVAGALQDGSIGERHNPETHLIPIILQVANGKRDKLTVYGNDYPTPDGSCIRDYIHVTDLVDAHIKAYNYLKNGGDSGCFNLGIGKGFSVLEIVEAARQVTGHAIPVEIGERRAGDPAVLIASGNAARETLGFNPIYTDPKDMVADAWRWHKCV